MDHIVSVSSNAAWSVFFPVLVDLPRFKGLALGCIFHGAIDRLTLCYCDHRLPLRLTEKYTHSPDFLHLMLDILLNVRMHRNEKNEGKLQIYQVFNVKVS